MTLDSPAGTATNGKCIDATMRLGGSGGRCTARLRPERRIWGANGGYLATLAFRTAGMCTDIPRPTGIRATFLRPPRFDEVTPDSVTLERGRRTEAFAATMTPDDLPVLAAQVQPATATPGYETPPAQTPDRPAPHTATRRDG